MIITHYLLQYSQHKLLLFYFTRERGDEIEEELERGWEDRDSKILKEKKL